MIRDLLLASVMSLALGAGCLELWARIRYPDGLALLGIALSIACGPYFLWKRGRKPMVPITAVYSVLMFFAILIVYFAIAWRFGRVDL
jgi:hypothetical protein